MTRAAHRPRFGWVQKALAKCFVAAMIVPIPQLVMRDFVQGLTKPPVPTESDLEVLFARDVAYRLRALGGRDVPVVASAPGPDSVIARMTEGMSTPRWAPEVPVPVPAELPSAWAFVYDVRRARDAR